MSTKPTEIVREALKNAPSVFIVPILRYHRHSFGKSSVGEMAKWINEAEWEVYPRSTAEPPLVAFKTDRHCHSVYIQLRDLNRDDELTFDSLLEEDYKGTVAANATAYLLGNRHDFATALVDMSGRQPVLMSVMGGPPVTPTRVLAAEWAGKTVSVSKAAEIGIVWARVRQQDLIGG